MQVPQLSPCPLHISVHPSALASSAASRSRGCTVQARGPAARVSCLALRRAHLALETRWAGQGWAGLSPGHLHGSVAWPHAAVQPGRAAGPDSGTRCEPRDFAGVCPLCPVSCSLQRGARASLFAASPGGCRHAGPWQASPRGGLPSCPGLPTAARPQRCRAERAGPGDSCAVALVPRSATGLGQPSCQPRGGCTAAMIAALGPSPGLDVLGTRRPAALTSNPWMFSGTGASLAPRADSERACARVPARGAALHLRVPAP